VTYLSVILFKLLLNCYKKLYIRKNTSIIIAQINSYVDGVVKISRNVKVLEKALLELDNIAHKTEVTMNQAKTKYTRVRRQSVSAYSNRSV